MAPVSLFPSVLRIPSQRVRCPNFGIGNPVISLLSYTMEFTMEWRPLYALSAFSAKRRWKKLDDHPSEQHGRTTVWHQPLNWASPARSVSAKQYTASVLPA